MMTARRRILFLLWISSSFLFASIRGRCLDDQRSLLLQLSHSLDLRQLSWDLNVDCCSWDGVGCDDAGSGRVIRLKLDNRSISGDLRDAPALFALRHLRSLNLARNLFSNAPIPRGLADLTRLEYLNLSNAGFTGQVPLQLSRITSLLVLDLSTQFQDASSPPLQLDLGTLVRNLTRLTELHLDGVNISSSSGSDWSRSLSSSLPRLRNLSLRRCGLSGPLHPSLSRLRYLSLLQLDDNDLRTVVPDFIADFTYLTTLTLSFCSLQGTFPDAIFQAPTLQHLDLTYNVNLTGTISRFPSDGSLRSIALSYTNFSGPLPASIGNLSMLSRIELSHCSFTGTIPSTIGHLTELRHLDFSFNSFTGSVPPFPMSKKLAYIDIGRNALTGSLSPSHFEGLGNLSVINLGHNALNGTIPASLFGLPSLQVLDLSNNKFSGQVGYSAWNPSSNVLDTLDLSSNALGGSIPEAFFNLEQLKVLSLFHNSFNGTVHLESIQKLRNLSRLELGYNRLSVDASSSSNSSLSQFPQLSKLNLASCNLNSYPHLLRNQFKLVDLDLSNNQITGQVPSWIWGIGNGALARLNLSFNLLEDFERPFSMPSLSVLDLHSNRLRGEFPIPPASVIYVDYSNNSFQNPIPSDIGNNITFAMFFSAASNQLNGTIPLSLCNATYLQVLDLSGNRLRGSLPPCLVESITRLGVLNLGRNSINGDIPDTFHVNCSLKTLDLSRNRLGGQIPTSLANCRSLEVMNVGNNEIQGGFPCMLRASSTLRVLVLRKNRFHGDLGCSGAYQNESWTNLQIIDVASNFFNGKLSESGITSWKGMAVDTDAERSLNHLRFSFLDMNNFYYQDRVGVTAKGLEVELVKILRVFTSIDFSCNYFQGEIPDTIGHLSALYVLNLSNNHLNGQIPKSIGNLTELESLDLSHNQLTGEIPKEIKNLAFLSFLNLSYNKLVGMIPRGSQLQTFSPSSFSENSGLCGFPLSTVCNSSAPHSVMMMDQDIDWKFIFIGLGYGVGAALAIAPLAFCKQWREQCNEHLDRFLKLIIPRYGFRYVRYDGGCGGSKIEGRYAELYIERYCVFCTKVDTQIKRAIRNPKCACHNSLPVTFSSSSIASSTSSQLVMHHAF
ncbi:receptor-like protein 33 [Andrographis paniculata]|uniref:receptor-like protein 33 n=1 Tax=Andrographis paniculata TaxID=175694 RepID=UPI0021E816F3|nr:receptor-like protein 33 [Andrographis paniculata]